MSCWLWTVHAPFVGGSTSQYGCEYGMSSGTLRLTSTLTGTLLASFAPTAFPGFTYMPATADRVQGKSERFTTVTLTGSSPPGLTEESPALTSMATPEQARMTSSSSCIFTGIHAFWRGSSAVEAPSFSIASWAWSSRGIDFDGSFGSNASDACCRIFPTASPPWRRDQLVSMPSNRSVVAGSPASWLK